MSYYQMLDLEREPFSTSPDPAFFYQSSKHRATLANLIIEFRLQRGLSVVLGDVGVGKTTLGRKLVQMLSERPGFLFHLILDPTYPSEELFYRALTQTLKIQLPQEHPTLLDYRDGLERFLYEKAVQQKQTVVLIIDEAHKLNALSLEALRVLLNYETNDTKLLQLVLLGQMELLPVLRGMPNLMDRISFKTTLGPLSLDETRELIDFRLSEAGYRSRLPLFMDDAVEAVHEGSQGYPRRISMLCHQALRDLVMSRRTAVDRSIVNNIVRKEIEGGWSPTRILQKSSY